MLLIEVICMIQALKISTDDTKYKYIENKLGPNVPSLLIA